MGVLPNPNHERFAQEVHRRTLARETRAKARTAAYRAHVLTGEATDEQIAPNARRLANSAPVAARIKELGEFAAKLAGIDANWAMLKLKGFADANLDDYLSRTPKGDRVLCLKQPTREQMGYVAELSQDEETVEGLLGAPTVVRKVKVKLYSPIDAIRLMGQIGGWFAPAKVAPTNPTGDGPAVVRHEFGEIDAVRRAIVAIEEEAERAAAAQAAGDL